MADPIRPFFSPVATPRPGAASVGSSGAGDAARAAQRAFFSQALAQAQAAPAPQRLQVASPATAPVMVAPARTVDPAAPFDRLQRPGSLLDIKV